MASASLLTVAVAVLLLLLLAATGAALPSEHNCNSRTIKRASVHCTLAHTVHCTPGMALCHLLKP